MEVLKVLTLVSKIASIQCPWVKRLFDQEKHDWKVIPLFLPSKYFSENFKFHNNMNIDKKLISFFPSFYQGLIINWIKNYSSPPTIVSAILSEYIWFNARIKIDNQSVFKHFFSSRI